jgi:hypothetical protein
MKAQIFEPFTQYRPRSHRGAYQRLWTSMNPATGTPVGPQMFYVLYDPRTWRTHGVQLVSFVTAPTRPALAQYFPQIVLSHL